MYTFDYKDEQHPDHESNGCFSVSSEETMENAIGENQGTSNHGENQPALFSSVRVYAIAEKYGILHLKELARERFCNWAEDSWAHEDFSDIIREIFESTPKHDRGLRDVVIRIVAMHADILIQKDQFRHLIEDFGDLGLGVLCQLSKTNSEEKSAFESRIKNLEAKIAVLTEQLTRCRYQSKNMNFFVQNQRFG